MFKKIFLLLITFYVAPSHATLMLTIDEMTTDTFTFSINGTFDEDSYGDIAGVLAIKYDWSNNLGVHTEFMNNANVESSTISFNDELADILVSGGVEHGKNDSISFDNIFGQNIAFLAGTVVSGSATLTGEFDPSKAAGLELLSGYKQHISWVGGLSNKVDWARHEADAVLAFTPPPSVVPAPSPLLLIIGAGLLVFMMERVKQNRSRKAVAVAA